MTYYDYYIDTENNKIHRGSCTLLLNNSNVFLGTFKNYKAASQFAEFRGYKNATLCKSCNYL
ncbi:hypothetical protein NRK67_03130 [Fusobacteria bacterium ZRK30]|nr:hypothetical protein NRK67_03130 [Fusobacteria bacterium ZRK30]